MLEANSLSELYDLMSEAKPGQIVAVPSKLFTDYTHTTKKDHGREIVVLNLKKLEKVFNDAKENLVRLTPIRSDSGLNYSYCTKHKTYPEDDDPCWQCIDEHIPFAQNFEQSEIKIAHCDNKDQAQALANFLWNERERHIKDIYAITDDLTILESKWDIKPTREKIFVKP